MRTPSRTPDPTPSEIVERAAECRRSWSDNDYARKGPPADEPKPWTVPVIAVAQDLLKIIEGDAPI